jgi:hypothetical protein
LELDEVVDAISKPATMQARANGDLRPVSRRRLPLILIDTPSSVATG